MGPFTFVVSCTSTHCSAKPFGKPLDCYCYPYTCRCGSIFELPHLPMCYLQLLATSHSLFVAFEADVGCLDDDAVKRQKSNLEHFHSVIFTIGPCQGLMCNLPRGSMQYLGVGLELRAIGGVSRHVLQPRHTLALCRWHITCASMRQRNPASSMPGVFMSYVLRRPFPLGLESLCESCALHAARPRLGGSARSLGQKSAIEMGYIDSDSAQR